MHHQHRENRVAALIAPLSKIVSAVYKHTINRGIFPKETRFKFPLLQYPYLTQDFLIQSKIWATPAAESSTLSSNPSADFLPEMKVTVQLWIYMLITWYMPACETVNLLKLTYHQTIITIVYKTDKNSQTVACWSPSPDSTPIIILVNLAKSSEVRPASLSSHPVVNTFTWIGWSATIIMLISMHGLSL